ncbi:uncharacterized protein EI90DRAFT_3121703 [Cantharellus anzutake]|uniref:uncharacterized protein n=1 Tax=Cantharellus anzutake TaxID=1750568 RepID=UPI001907EFE3|nr:uncharacterized protein EI90DRAFT_3121703 [Cantharellus anzutake]KAF8333445.1 hypothetical protein EI90DRAFT_3121703 [Cantharellus anzutake]
MTPITSISPPCLSLLPPDDANDPRTTSSFDSLLLFLPSTSALPLELLYCFAVGNLRTYLNSHSYLRTSPTTPPPPRTSCSKEMDLLVVGNSQLAHPPSLLLVSAPLAPPVVYLRYLPTPTLPPVMLFFIVLSFDIFYNPNLLDYNFRALDLSGHLPL